MMPKSKGILKRLMEQIERTQEVEYDCGEVHRLLDQYAEFYLEQGEDARTLMPLVQQHLELCPDCKEELDALLRALEATLDET